MVSQDVDYAVQTRSVSKTFKDFWLRPRVRAVHDLNLNIERGLVYGLLGPNGSGKSTTIKMLLGLLYPSEGHIAVLGQPPTNVAVKKKIGYLPEESYLYRFLNAYETLDYYGRLFHIPRLERKARVEQLLEMVGLDVAAHRPLSEYSKGMQRRLGLAQALINDPELLILDEPTTGMDPPGTRKIKDLIMTLKGKTTVILSSHLLDVVEDVSDRIAMLYGGRMLREGTVSDLLEVGDETHIKVQNPSESALNRISDVLEGEGSAVLEVTRPRRKLESLFMGVIDEARSKGIASSGAQQGGDVAGFLKEAEEGNEARAVINELVEVTAPEVKETDVKPLNQVVDSPVTLPEKCTEESEASPQEAGEDDSPDTKLVESSASSQVLEDEHSGEEKAHTPTESENITEESDPQETESSAFSPSKSSEEDLSTVLPETHSQTVPDDVQSTPPESSSKKQGFMKLGDQEDQKKGKDDVDRSVLDDLL